MPAKVTRTISNDDAIRIKGVKVHNLKNVDVTIPRDALTVITGPSGSGKSSLAFDTIYAEGQRRYVESLSSYARQFLDQLSKPDLESISGLSPTLSIEQRTTSYNPRSTVGTVTEIYDFLRLLFARISKAHCWSCGDPIQAQTRAQICDQILALPAGTKLSLLAPIVRDRKGEYQKELYQLRQKGFVRVRVDGEILDLQDDIHLDKNKKHKIEVYVDRVIMREDLTSISTRISESVDLALKLGEGLLILEVPDRPEVLLSEKRSCLRCHISYSEPEPRTFSFNSPAGACASCDGLGIEPREEVLVDEELPDTTALLPEEDKVCQDCAGKRLKKESLSYQIESGSKKVNIHEVCSLSLSDLHSFFTNLVLTERQQLIAGRIVKEIIERSSFLIQVGVAYLSLSRSAQSLSGGENQRIRLATQIGSSLVGVTYILDEPSIGLHQSDNDKLLESLRKLQKMGNTVIVVEHDQDTIKQADWILDFGPGAGAEGGEIVAAGKLADILASKKSLTGKYLRGELQIAVPKIRRPWSTEHCIEIIGATANNLKAVQVTIPLGIFICVTGVSGSGKSTLIIDTLYRHLLQSLYKMAKQDTHKAFEKIVGLEKIDKVIDIDQSPIGKTPRSNPATYTGLFSLIRDLFASLPESKVRGFSAGRYSFNVKGGRCEKCEGDGTVKIVMHFLPDVYVACDVCKGQRYNNETLEIRYKGKNIAEVLAMTGVEALPFFDALPSIKSKLVLLNEVGLGYLQLGQSATTLSGGEAQRMKLAKELSRRGTGKTLYLLDEPSTGLHFDDIKKLIAILQRLVDQGNTVIVIEHNLDIIKVADHIIDLGPGGGQGGGEIVAAGTPEEVIQSRQSLTAKYLKPYLAAAQTT